ncbi:MAG: KH domain-containing protein [Oscillospiraceae bacterium]|nr:KH domain-containing protein [Oscillospiraceae bacterium]
MKEMLHDIVAAIIGEDAKIEITEKENNGMTVLELSVAKEDMGKVIGRKGKIAKAIRTVVKACANRQNKKVSVEIL